MKKTIIIIILTTLILTGTIFLIVIKTKKDENNGICENEIKSEELENTYNITEINKISKYIPHNINRIVITNYLSDLEKPTENNIEDIEEIKEFMNLIIKADWNIAEEYQLPKNFDGAFYQIIVYGDKEMVLNMQGSNSEFGLIKIQDEHYIISKTIYEKMRNFKEKKYYLHDSKLSIPKQEECYAMKNKALYDLNETNKKLLQESIRNIHYYLEWNLIDAVKLIKNENSPYWDEFNNYGVFKDPYTGNEVLNEKRFIYILDEISKIKDIPKNEDVRNDLNKAYNILKEGMNQHNLEQCFESHKIIHDYDYFVINAPVYLETPPADWAGVTTYFGTISKLN